ncbi:MAG TPA: ATP-binding protein [Bryobacteraceae bacterium]|nr:ATP-binding protein [Bryobacteraceae bacterium]
MHLALKMVHHYRTEARRVIWQMRESRLDSETLVDLVSAALRQLTDGTGIRGEVQVSGRVLKLPEDLERNVLRIAQEAGSNARNHGHPSNIHIRMDYRPDALVLTVDDDGAGFDPKAADGVVSGHFGLTVMRERAEQFGGALHLASQPGGGTVVEAKVPIRAARGK